MLWTIVLLIAVVMVVITGEFPSPTPEIAMRRAEKRMLTGPCEIIGNDYIKTAYDFDYMALVGESEYGYTLFEYMQANAYYDNGIPSYHEKQDVFTLFGSADNVHYADNATVYPLWVFTEDSSARSAVLTLTCSYTFQDEHYEQVYTLEAQRSENGYFLFLWDYREVQDRLSLEFLLDRINGRQYTSNFLFGTATLELYDNTGQLIDTLSKEYPSLAQ